VAYSFSNSYFSEQQTANSEQPEPGALLIMLGLIGRGMNNSLLFAVRCVLFAVCY